MKVFYTEKQNSDQGEQSFGEGVIKSPSSRKPGEVAQALKQFDFIEFVEPNPISIEDFKLCHDSQYVDDILNLKAENGFGSISQSVNDSLPYTTGAMLDATMAATPEMPTAALVSGFHHAGYDRWRGLGYFCTFNGLMVTAVKWIKTKGSGCCILDCDMHWGNGTDDIIKKMHKNAANDSVLENLSHFTLGKHFKTEVHAGYYLHYLRETVVRAWRHNKPGVIVYQSGADVHVDDPYGGVLTTEQMMERDRIVFTAAKELGIPIAWNLAGGYQIGPNGEIDKVLELHLNTFKVANEVYNNATSSGT